MVTFTNLNKIPKLSFPEFFPYIFEFGDDIRWIESFAAVKTNLSLNSHDGSIPVALEELFYLLLHNFISA